MIKPLLPKVHRLHYVYFFEFPLSEENLWVSDTIEIEVPESLFYQVVDRYIELGYLITVSPDPNGEWNPENNPYNVYTVEASKGKDGAYIGSIYMSVWGCD